MLLINQYDKLVVPYCIPVDQRGDEYMVKRTAMLLALVACSSLALAETGSDKHEAAAAIHDTAAKWHHEAAGHHKEAAKAHRAKDEKLAAEHAKAATEASKAAHEKSLEAARLHSK
jgi:hypothetical protein